MVSTASQVLSCSLALPLTPAPSLLCLKEGVTTVSPSFLGGSWSSVEALDHLVVPLTPASLGLQATPAGVTSTLRGAYK